MIHCCCPILLSLSFSLSRHSSVWNTLLDLSDVLYEPEFLTPRFPEKLQAHRLTHFPMINATGNYLNVNGGNTHAHSHAHYSYTNQHKHIRTETHHACQSGSLPHLHSQHLLHTSGGQLRRKNNNRSKILLGEVGWAWWGAEALLAKRVNLAENSNAAFPPKKKNTEKWAGWTLSPLPLFCLSFSEPVCSSRNANWIQAKGTGAVSSTRNTVCPWILVVCVHMAWCACESTVLCAYHTTIWVCAIVCQDRPSPLTRLYLTAVLLLLCARLCAITAVRNMCLWVWVCVCANACMRERELN